VAGGGVLYGGKKSLSLEESECMKRKISFEVRDYKQ
jgi:hypothetical protein